MSKPVKNLIEQSYRQRFDGLDSALLIDLRGIPANQNNALRSQLSERQIRLTVVKNSLARRAWQGTSLQRLAELLDGPCAVAYGGTAVEIARALLDRVKEVKFEFRGALMEGELFGPQQIEALSKYPTRHEAQAQVLGTVLGAGGQLVATITSAGGQILSILEALEKKREEETAGAAAG